MTTRHIDNRIHFRWPEKQRGRLYDMLMQGEEGLEEFLATKRNKRNIFGPDKFTVAEEGFALERRCYYDTFDWRLFKKGLVLVATDERLMLRSAETGKTLLNHEFGADGPSAAAALDVCRESMGLAKDFPDGPLRDRIRSVTGIRALLRIAYAQSARRRYQVLNQDEKIVVRFALRELILERPDEEPISMIDAIVYPVRGYTDEEAELIKALTGKGFVEHPVPPDYAWILEQTRQTPGAYSAKPPFPITPEMPSDEAAKAILRPLHEVMRTNEAGVIADLDTEFLHDFRTSIRRTRSALSQIRSVFPKATTKYYKSAFADLGKLTNELRDLDVYLLSRKRYRKMLPKSMRADIDPMFGYLATKRAGALARVRAGLQSDEYQRLMDEWAAFLHEPTSQSALGSRAEMPISELARNRLLKRYRKLLSEGNRILEENDAALLHELRIDGKKLRYLMEFFAEILPPKESKALIKQMKRLQENLGAFNDLSVQQAYLLHIADELPMDDPSMRRTLVAIGALIEKLSTEQERVQAEFADIFSEFASPANQSTFARLINGNSK